MDVVLLGVTKLPSLCRAIFHFPPAGAGTVPKATIVGLKRGKRVAVSRRS